MGIVMRFGKPSGLDADDQKKYDELKAKYENKVYLSTEEFLKDKKKIDKELEKITGEVTKDTTLKYGSTVYADVMSSLNDLKNMAATPEEDIMWTGFLDEMAEAKGLDEDGPNESLTVTIGSNAEVGGCRCFSAEAEAKMEEVLKRIRTACRELKSRLPETKEYTADGFKKDTLDYMIGVIDVSVDVNLEELYSTYGDSDIINLIGGFVDGTSEYSKKRSNDADEPNKASDYARAHSLLSFYGPSLHAMEIAKSYKTYRDKLSAGKARTEDEMEARRAFLSESSACLYDMGKIQKNLRDKRVRPFLKLNGNVYTDAIGDRNPFNRYRYTLTAKRNLIKNGWPMADANALGRAAKIAFDITVDLEHNRKEWEKYERNLEAFNNKEREEAPRKPVDRRYTDEEIEALEKVVTKMETLVSSAPGNEAERNRILNSMLEETRRGPQSLRKFFPRLEDIGLDLKNCMDRKLTNEEKEILGNPSVLDQMFNDNPVMEYTDEEQNKDIEEVAGAFEKDKELNDIFKTDPWAHDMIRSLEAHARTRKEFVDAVKNTVGAGAFDEFEARQGRTDDYSKALDILTLPDSPFNVSNDHNILENVRTSLSVLQKTGNSYSSVSVNDLQDISSVMSGALEGLTGDHGQERIDEALRGEADFSREQEYINRMNAVLSAPGNMSAEDQQKEIAACVEGLLIPYGNKVLYGLKEDTGNILDKAELNDTELSQAPDLYSSMKPDGQKYLNADMLKRLQPVMETVERGLNRADKLLRDNNNTEAADRLSALRGLCKNVRLGTLTSEIEYMEPIVSDIRMQGQNEEYNTARRELKDIWTNFAAERKNGNLTPELEKQYWKLINEKYDAIEAIYAKQPLQSFEDAEPQQEVPDEDDIPGIDNDEVEEIGNPFLSHEFRQKYGINLPKTIEPVSVAEIEAGREEIASRREAIKKGWSLSDSPIYCRLKEIKDLTVNFDAEGYTPAVKELDGCLKDLFDVSIDKISPEMAFDRIQKVYRAMDAVRGYRDSLEFDKAIRKADSRDHKRLDALIDKIEGIGVSAPPVQEKYLAEKPLIEELKSVRNRMLMAKQYSDLETVSNEIEQLKENGAVDTYVYDEVKTYLNRDRTVPKQEFGTATSAYNDLSDKYINDNLFAADLVKYMGAVKEGKETTFSVKAGIDRKESLKAINRMLNAADSFFHGDSSQFKSVKSALSKLEKGTLNEAGMQKLKEDVKKWITDPKYNRIKNHNKNAFDNTRFNYMFALANELDPKWAKENFDSMKFSILPGDKAAKSEFYNIHDFLNYAHRELVNNDCLSEAQAIRNARASQWYHKPQAAGEAGMVEEADRISRDASYAARDRMKVELANLSKLTGDDINEPDKEMKRKLGFVTSYRRELDKLVENNQYINRRMEKEGLKNIRDKAIDQIKSVLDDPKNVNTRLFTKAVAAYGVIDPKAAHGFIRQYNEAHAKDKKAKTVSLLDLEKKEGLDIGGRKDYLQKKAEKRAARARGNEGPNAEGNIIQNPSI